MNEPIFAILLRPIATAVASANAHVLETGVERFEIDNATIRRLGTRDVAWRERSTFPHRRTPSVALGAGRLRRAFERAKALRKPASAPRSRHADRADPTVSREETTVNATRRFPAAIPFAVPADRAG